MAETSVDLINLIPQRLIVDDFQTNFELALNKNDNDNDALKLKRSFFDGIWDASAKARKIESPIQYSVVFAFGVFALDRAVMLVRDGKNFTVEPLSGNLAKGEVFQGEKSGHILRVTFLENNSTYNIIIHSYETQHKGVILIIGPILLRQFYQSETSSGFSESLVGSSNKSDCPRIFIQATTDYFSGLNMAQVVYTLLDTQSNQKLSKFSNYPTLVERGKGCTFIEKIIWTVDNHIISKVEYYQYLARMTLYGTLQGVCQMSQEKTDICKSLDVCLACAQNSLHKILDCQKQPLANGFYLPSDPPPESYPLAFNVCLKCWHCQNSHVIDPSVLFCDYAYVSGTSATGKNFFDDFAKYIVSLATQPKDRKLRVLDIACNDGSQLDCFDKKTVETYGVDPAQNLLPHKQSERTHHIVQLLEHQSCKRSSNDGYYYGSKCFCSYGKCRRISSCLQGRDA